MLLEELEPKGSKWSIKLHAFLTVLSAEVQPIAFLKIDLGSTVFTRQVSSPLARLS